MNTRKNFIRVAKALALLFSGLLIGYVMFANKRGHQPQMEEQGTWICSMHPQIQQSSPGKCPLCDMDLILAKETGFGAAHAHSISLSEEAKALARIETIRVERRFPEAALDLYGKIAWDETRIKTISAYFPGRIDRLFIDYTGIKVRKGDHLAEIYSPDLLSAQTELITSLKFNNKETTKAAREKLRLWGFSEEKIKSIEKTGKTSDRLEISSPLSGIVVNKFIQEGAYVQTGTPFFKIADLSKIWLLIGAYESDLPWLRFGQQVTFSVKSLPGEVFTGRISFIAPEVDLKTRTVNVRVNSKNPQGRLLPGMFAHVVVKAQVAGSGNIISPDFLNKWICPMHPEIVSDVFKGCSICGMDLEKASELGYESEDLEKNIPLLIPAGAPLITGKRAVVYVEMPDRESPTYEGRIVELGPRAGDYYIVRKGLKEGELVVKKGGFLLDASLQISAKPSMMSNESTE